MSGKIQDMRARRENTAKLDYFVDKLHEVEGNPCRTCNCKGSCVRWCEIGATWAKQEMALAKKQIIITLEKLDRENRNKTVKARRAAINRVYARCLEAVRFPSADE